MTRLFCLSARSKFLPARARRYQALALALGVSLSGLAPCAFAQDAAPSQTNYNIQVDSSHPAPISTSSNKQNPEATPPQETTQKQDAAPESAASVALLSDSQTTEAPADNPYGLKALWQNGDMIARIVLLIMAIMAAGTWIIMVVKFIEQARLFQAAREASRSFWNQPSIEEGAHSLKTNSPFRYIAETGLAASAQYKGAVINQINRQAWLELSLRRSVEVISSRLQGGLAFLGTVGSIAPFVGLFGTVWGIYHALTAIGVAGQATLDKVAGPVGESLIMTAIGLATAVPAVLGYNLLVRRNKAAMERTRNFAADMHAVLIGGFRHDAIFSDSHDAPRTTLTPSDRV
ncbi:MotA/TolQ/ExbB proton channel family protein [Aristophania vespae]|uniref:Biopolymer transport protein ExbB n=2 Tax=Aristophania vespae TaxID=2697033 RepID=A0A6P1NGT0_9PROT|nr:MotA/TolQ/ExbB proton channel family protein [Aristophania vespae]